MATSYMADLIMRKGNKLQKPTVNILKIMMYGEILLISVKFSNIFFIKNKESKKIKHDNIKTKNLSVKYSVVIKLKGR